jgi:hypothetical protein
LGSKNIQRKKQPPKKLVIRKRWVKNLYSWEAGEGALVMNPVIWEVVARKPPASCSIASLSSSRKSSAIKHAKHCNVDLS